MRILALGCAGRSGRGSARAGRERVAAALGRLPTPPPHWIGAHGHTIEEAQITGFPRFSICPGCSSSPPCLAYVP
eukprot:8669993-Pyramimonas_sp.AAC.1